MSSPLVVDYYSDILCVWAWIAQRRIDELHEQLGDKIELRYHYMDVFGDAINKVADFILRIINNPNSIVLIDEIENGIHYSNQEKLWKMLFNLAIEYNVQIFSTTHSYEMVKAFVNTIKENEFDEKSSYFELARHAKTGNIIATYILIDILDYDIENNFPFRGE